MKFKINVITSIGLILTLLTVLIGPLLQIAQAAALTSKKDTMSSLKASTVSNHTILFTTPTGVAAGQTITLTLTSFSVAAGLDFEDLDLSIQAAGGDGVCDTGDTEKTLAAAPSGATWGAVRTSGTVITFTSGTDTIAAGAEVCVEVGTGAEQGPTGVEQITNPAAGSYTLAIGGTMTDSGSVGIAIIADDQVAVSGTVNESITFTISDNSIGFGTLSATTGRWATGDLAGGDASGALPTAAHSMTIASNGTGGYTISYNGATLTSGSDTIDDAATIDEDSDGTPGSEQFGLCASTSGDATIAAGYLRDTAADWDFVVSTATTLVSEIIPTATETISVSYLANISGATDAGSYSTAITYTAVANF